MIGSDDGLAALVSGVCFLERRLVVESSKIERRTEGIVRKCNNGCEEICRTSVAPRGVVEDKKSVCIKSFDGWLE